MIVIKKQDLTFLNFYLQRLDQKPVLTVKLNIMFVFHICHTVEVAMLLIIKVAMIKKIIVFITA